jgi:hypothetical protein
LLAANKTIAATGGSAWLSTVWPTANKAFYLPFVTSQPLTITKLFWYDGATLSGNVDCGVYDRFGNLLVSTGSTAQSDGTVNTLRVIDTADTLIQPGAYYLALVKDDTTGTIFTSVALVARHMILMGVLSQTSAFVLPATATMARDTAATFLPVFGLLNTITAF